jgi:hypothetical protein
VVGVASSAMAVVAVASGPDVPAVVAVAWVSAGGAALVLVGDVAGACPVSQAERASTSTSMNT